MGPRGGNNLLPCHIPNILWHFISHISLGYLIVFFSLLRQIVALSKIRNIFQLVASPVMLLLLLLLLDIVIIEQ